MSRICFALDGMSDDRAQAYVSMLEDHVAAFKVGLELFIRSGKLPRTTKPIVLDLKLHDIPETVVGAVKAGGDLGASFMTLHVQQRATLEAAAKAAEEFNIQLLAVTVLTSMQATDLIDLGSTNLDVARKVVSYANLASSCGINGFVCSPNEVSRLKSEIPSGFFLVPGIRPAGAALNDQVRVGTPKKAVNDGASLIVVGRPIRDAADSVEAATAINKECHDES